MDDVHYSTRFALTKATAQNRNQNVPALQPDLQAIMCRADQKACTIFKLPVNRDVPNTMDALSTAPIPQAGMKDFLRIGLKRGTDKVTDHRYEFLYQEYLGPFSEDGVQPFTFMEIGYSGGNSARTWQEFLPSADIHEFEISCDKPYSHAHLIEHRNVNGINLHCGDAMNKDVVQESLANVSQPFVIVDDGGHGPDDMLVPFKREWQRLQPGGFYFMEDLAESYQVDTQGFVQTMIKPLMVDLVSQGDAHYSPAFAEISSTLDHIKCMQHICVFAKKKL
jgi:hypothetical protein